ncbi:hypothetical protein LOZ66_002166 [Ophidiomyces ophidiicola]|nr:hypothetical protein LOZ65_000822 [Ophidiomyces ophidiicola]KAI1940570.1 hypothetical protein LOZ66_002166 [Ophidiomyces ophidiicola]
MGASASKSARTAASAASRRQYPKQPSPSTTAQHSRSSPPPPPARPTPQTIHSAKEKASQTKTEAIDLDARDPDFAASLRSIGPVTPSPTFSNSSTFNPSSSSYASASSNAALGTLSARSNLSRLAEQELESFGKQSHAGRQFLDVVTIKNIVTMRDREGLSPAQIEKYLRLKAGVVERLGKKGVVGEV